MWRVGGDAGACVLQMPAYVLAMGEDQMLASNAAGDDFIQEDVAEL